eukprot:Hpha_TRINITY_DN15517_c2_g1::TRINITY_DN15517_c2_g1_i1::g.107118::m.107118
MNGLLLCFFEGRYEGSIWTGVCPEPRCSGADFSLPERSLPERPLPEWERSLPERERSLPERERNSGAELALPERALPVIGFFPLSLRPLPLPPRPSCSAISCRNAAHTPGSPSSSSVGLGFGFAVSLAWGDWVWYCCSARALSHARARADSLGDCWGEEPRGRKGALGGTPPTSVNSMTRLTGLFWQASSKRVLQDAWPGLLSRASRADCLSPRMSASAAMLKVPCVSCLSASWYIHSSYPDDCVVTSTISHNNMGPTRFSLRYCTAQRIRAVHDISESCLQPESATVPIPHIDARRSHTITEMEGEPRMATERSPTAPKIPICARPVATPHDTERGVPGSPLHPDMTFAAKSACSACWEELRTLWVALKLRHTRSPLAKSAVPLKRFACSLQLATYALCRWQNA